MRWECSKPDLRSTLIYMPKPTGTHRHRGTRPQAYAGARTHTHTHTHTGTRTHSLLDTDPHSSFLLLSPPLSERKPHPAWRGRGWVREIGE